MHMFSLVCMAREGFFFYRGRVHVISTGPISTFQTEGQRFHFLEQKEKLLQALTSALLKSQDCSNC
ncbi:unnamed protein product [Staurois parvus]|uniref:Uncharacterized protein n=1 Tax=Staurois parvus TaxID=386267 RepID=A0ABN9HLQ2_9NEOB|nr:unnamed protein product [Staurois parvus]